MERCLDCDCMLTNDEKICQVCGAHTGYIERGNGSGVAEFLSNLGRILLCFSLAELMLAQFIPIAPSVGIFLCLFSSALMFNNSP